MSGDVSSMVSCLSPRDIRLMGLLFEGRSDKEISEELKMPHGTLRGNILRLCDRIRATRRGREVLIRFYIDHLIGKDLQGQPRDAKKTRYVQPGEKLAEWRAWAHDRRDLILRDPELPRHMWKAILLLAEPANAGLSYEDLGRQVKGARNGAGVKGSTYEGYARAVFRAMKGGNRTTLFVVVVLTSTS